MKAMRMHRAFVIVLFVVVRFAAPAQTQDNIHAFAHRLDEHYNHLQSLQANFQQTYRGNGQERVESGKLWLKKPGKMRWEYAEPRSKLFVVDGHTAFFYVPGESQARKSSLKKLDDLRTPLRYLLGKTKLEKEVDHLTIVHDRTSASRNTVLQGMPHGMADRITELQLEVNENYEIVRILIREVDGSETEFRFDHLIRNIPAPEELFRFVPPAGVRVLQNESLSP